MTRSARASSSHDARRGHARNTISWTMSSTPPSRTTRRAVDQRVDGRRQLGRDVGGGDAAAHPLPVIGDVDEPEQDVADRVVVAGIVERPLAEPLDGGGESADLDVLLGGEDVAVAALPHLGQRRRGERQGAVLAGDVGDEERRPAPVRRRTRSAGPAGGDPPQLVLGRWPDQHLSVVDQLDEVSRASERAVLVGPHDQDDVDVERRVEHEVEQAARRRRRPRHWPRPPRTDRR